MKSIIIISLILVLTIQSNADNITDIIRKKILTHLDSCFTPELKSEMRKSVLIKGSDSPFDSVSLSFNELRPYFKCFDIIDSVFVNDSNFRKHSGTLLFGFERLVTEIIYKAYYQHLNHLPLTFEYDLDSLKEIKRVFDSTSIAWKTADSINGVYIPKNLDEALDLLDSLVPEERINEFKNHKDENKAVFSEYFGLGTYLITNVWKAGGSRLHKYFVEKGIHSHDAIKVLILRSWYRRLNNRPIKFEEQIKEAIKSRRRIKEIYKK